MPMTQEEAEKILDEKSKKFDDDLRAKDTDSLMTQFHPKVIFQYESNGEEKTVHGIENIKKFYDYAVSFNVNFDNRVTYKTCTVDGKYLILQGEYTLEGHPGTNHWQQVFQRQDDGEYLVFYQRRGTYKF